MSKRVKQWISLILIGAFIVPTGLDAIVVTAQGEDISPLESVEFGRPTQSSNESSTAEMVDQELSDETAAEQEPGNEMEESEEDQSSEEEAMADAEHPAIDLMERLSQMQTGIVADYTIFDYLEGEDVLAQTFTLIKDSNHYLLTDQSQQQVPQTVLLTMDEETQQIQEIYQPVKDLARNVSYAMEQGIEEGITPELESLTHLSAMQINDISNLYIDLIDQKEDYESTLEQVQQTSAFLFLLGQRFVNHPMRTAQFEEVAPDVYELAITDELLDELKQLIAEEKDNYPLAQDVVSLFESGKASTMLFNTAAMEYGIGTLADQAGVEYYFSAQGKALRLPTDEQVVTFDELLEQVETSEEA